MIDYTGKLNEHQDYIKILEKIKVKCEYIEIVVIDERKSNELIDIFKNDILEVKKVSKWWGTETKSSNYLYKINFNNALYEKLKEYETFCKYFEYGSNEVTLRRGDYSETNNFGIDDIAFYDSNNNCLLCTTTHEGYILINKNVL